MPRILIVTLNVYREIEKRYGEVRTKANKQQKKNSMLGVNLNDIRQEVDAYMSWLNDKEAELKKDTPIGYTVKEAEDRLKKQKVKIIYFKVFGLLKIS